MYHCVYVACPETFSNRLGVELPAGSLWCVVHEDELPDADALARCGHATAPFGPDRPDYAALVWDTEKRVFVARQNGLPEVVEHTETQEARGGAAPHPVRRLLARLTGRRS